MKRIQDNYHWETLEHWKFVLDKKVVDWKKETDGDLTDKELRWAIEHLMQDCFPVAIVCSRQNEKIKLLETPLWKGIFEFLNNERRIKINDNLVSFENMGSKEKQKILSAQIYSIWLKE